MQSTICGLSAQATPNFQQTLITIKTVSLDLISLTYGYCLNTQHGLKCGEEYCVPATHTTYGGRGLGIDKLWINEDGFQNFILDMDWRPNNNYSIERVNNNLGYYPDNCVWATKLEQQNNRRKPRNNTSGYIGVSKIRNGAYSARLRYNNEEYHLLQTKNIEEAALAYDVAAIFFKGSQATTNILKL